MDGITILLICLLCILIIPIVLFLIFFMICIWSIIVITFMFLDALFKLFIEYWYITLTVIIIIIIGILKINGVL